MPNLGILIAEFELLTRAAPATGVRMLPPRLAAQSASELLSVLLPMAPALSLIDGSEITVRQRAPGDARTRLPLAAGIQLGSMATYERSDAGRGSLHHAPPTTHASAGTLAPSAFTGVLTPAGVAGVASGGAGAVTPAAALIAVLLVCLLAALLSARLTLEPFPLHSIVLSSRLEHPG